MADNKADAEDMFSRVPGLEQALSVLTNLYEARMNTSEPMSLEFGYRDASTLEHKSIRIVIDEGTHDLEEFGDVIDKEGFERAKARLHKDKEDDTWQIGI